MIGLALGLAGAAAALAAPPAPAQPVSFNMGLCRMSTGALDTTNFRAGDFTIPTHISVNCPSRTIDADRAKGNFGRKRATLYGHVVIHDMQGATGLSDFSPAGTSTQGPATLNSDQLEIDSQNKIYTAIGNVHYVQGNRVIDARRGTLDDNTKILSLDAVHFAEGVQSGNANHGVLNDRTHDLDLTGSVHVIDGAHSMDADHILYNTQTGALHARGHIVMQFPGQEPGAPAPAPTPKKKRLIPF
jgi:lipopolysaccharide transport protein LptA